MQGWFSFPAYTLRGLMIWKGPVRAPDPTEMEP